MVIKSNRQRSRIMCQFHHGFPPSAPAGNVTLRRSQLSSVSKVCSNEVIAFPSLTCFGDRNLIAEGSVALPASLRSQKSVSGHCRQSQSSFPG